MSDESKRRGLGRGLSALMADIEPSQTPGDTGSRTLSITAIHPNPDQPRRQFDEDGLNDLAASIREKGLIQPIVVRRDPNEGDSYQIVAGERRWRAAQRAQLHELPVIIRAFDDQEVLEIAIIENVQRVDLNPIEEALGLRQLVDRFGHTQDQLARVLGKSRSHIANQMRLLKLPEEVLEHVRAGSLSAGHARALLAAEDPVKLAKTAIAKGWSVRELERRVRTDARSQRIARDGRGQRPMPTRGCYRTIYRRLSGWGVVIDHRSDGAGRVTIQYKDLQQLDQLCEFLTSVGTDRVAK